MYEREEEDGCFVTHRCLQEEMRQRLKSEIDLTRIGECILSNNNRLITCDRNVRRNHETDGEAMQTFDCSIIPGGLSQSELSNAFECFRMNAFYKLKRGKIVLSFIYFRIKRESQENLGRSMNNIGLAYLRIGDIGNGFKICKRVRQRLYDDKHQMLNL
jgi:hypothetical protein